MRNSTFTSRFLTAVAALVAVFGLTLTLSGCSQNVDMSTVTAIIDVRTPDEFASGHVDGAVNIDWEGATFADEVAALDKHGTYLLYCRSGNRAGQAKAAMEQMGFTHVTNLGGYQDAANATGLPLVP
ncbi:MAG: hypothetical protein RLZ72_1001 [Actinomycetota bacterium]|jgi:rhodanese-related sulfurtransferase